MSNSHHQVWDVTANKKVNTLEGHSARAFLRNVVSTLGVPFCRRSSGRVQSHGRAATDEACFLSLSVGEDVGAKLRANESMPAPELHEVRRTIESCRASDPESHRRGMKVVEDGAEPLHLPGQVRDLRDAL